MAVNRSVATLVAAPDSVTDLSIDLSGQWPDELPRADLAWVPQPGGSDPEDLDRVRLLRLDVRTERYWRVQYVVAEVQIEFVVDARGSKIWGVWGEGVLFDDVVAYLLGPVLGIVLRLRGVTCLHASVLTTEGKALAITGPKTAGKSTTAAGLARQGLAVLSDDIAALTDAGEHYVVEPGYPRLRLWNPAITALHGSRDRLPKVLSVSNKRYLDLTCDDATAPWQFHTRPTRLAAVYVLGRCAPKVNTPTIVPLSGTAALTALVANTYGDVVASRAPRAQDFVRLGRLARDVPIRRVDRPDSIAALSELCAAITEDFARISGRLPECA